jgi:hypothetical protein
MYHEGMKWHPKCPQNQAHCFKESNAPHYCNNWSNLGKISTNQLNLGIKLMLYTKWRNCDTWYAALLNFPSHPSILMSKDWKVFSSQPKRLTNMKRLIRQTQENFISYFKTILDLRRILINTCESFNMLNIPLFQLHAIAWNLYPGLVPSKYIGQKLLSLTFDG